MSGLDQFLKYLDRSDVKALFFESGAPAKVRIGNEFKPLTKQPLTVSHILGFFKRTPVIERVPDGDTTGTREVVEIGGKPYAVTIARHQDRIQIRLEVAEIRRGLDEPKPAGPAAQPAPARPAAPKPAAARPAPAKPAPAKPAPAPAPKPVELAPSGSGEQRLAAILAQARGLVASDVHIMSDEAAHMRCAGRLEPRGAVLSSDDVRAMLHAVLSERHETALEERGYADFALELPKAGRLRVNVCRQRGGLKGCFRLVADAPSEITELGLPEELAKIGRYHQGLAIVSGPNGQGKTTTMAALIDLLNGSKPIHIITVEDPVEVIHPVKKAIVSQREVGSHTESFHRALKAALREDPDVIAIGELRDRETVEMALQASETGHLVIATMSTPSGAKTIDRLIDMFPPDDQAQVRATLAGSLKLVISQRLVPSADESRMHAAAELITGNVPLWSLIRDNKLFQLPSLLQRGRNFGMIKIEDSLSELWSAGLITEETARQYADDPRGLKNTTATDGTEAPEEPARRGRGGLGGLFGRRGS